MMMPANYSAIAENEMVYVNGGWSGQIGPIKEISTLTSNIINIVGNTFMSSVIGNTLGVMFGGAWGYKDAILNAGYDSTDSDSKQYIRNTVWNNWTNDLEERATLGYESGKTGFRGIVNAGMRVVGGLAAIAQLMNNDVKAYAAESDPIGISGLPV